MELPMLENLTAEQAVSTRTWNTTINGSDVNVSMTTTTTLVAVAVGEGREESEGLISDELRHIFEVMNFVILSGVISFLGCIFNVINIIVFVRQGLNDSITISLLGLAISDFGALVTLLWMSVCFNPYFALSDISFNSTKVQYLTAGWPHVCFARITSFITAYITFERCLCIVLPLKVKNIITPKRSLCVIVSIFLFQIASVAPVYYAIRLGWVFNEERNTSLIDLVYVSEGPFIENMSFSFNVATQITAVLAVIIFSVILVHGLRVKSKWRQKVTCSAAGNENRGNDNVSNKNNNKSNGNSSRDQKVVKMVLFLATIFIVCFLPSAINLIVMISLSEYSIVGQYKNLFQVGWSFLNTLEATNSTINIFVYLRMSSKYRQEFRQLCCRGQQLPYVIGRSSHRSTVGDGNETPPTIRP